MRQSFWLVIATVLLLMAATVFPAINYIEKQKVMESADGLVYTFIVGKVEGNDDLLASILTKKAQGIIKPGRHAFPGDAEVMGDRYAIERFDHDFPNGNLLYRIDFYRPSTKIINTYNVVVFNDEGTWKILKNTSIDNFYMNQLINSEKGIMVHEWER